MKITFIEISDDLRKLNDAIDKASDSIPCQSSYPDAWFPEKDDQTVMTAMAKKLCNQCPVQQACLEYAIDNEVHGIWGGLNYRDRLKLRPAQRGKKVGS